MTEHGPAARPGSGVERALLFAAMVSLGLAAAKGGAYAATGSLVALGSFFDSLGDVVVSLVNRLVHRGALKHADREHPYGHGGFEVLASLAQGVALVALASWLVVRCVARLKGRGGEDALAHENLWIAIAVLGASALAGFVIQRRLRRARLGAERSLALEADSAHYTGDAVQNLVGAIGLGVVWWTGDARLDAGLGLVAAGVLAFSAWPVLQRSIGDVVQREAGQELQAKVAAIAQSVDPRVVGIHRLRTRELGPTLFVDFHLVLPGALSLAEAHAIADMAMARVKAAIPRADVLVHMDPDSEPDD